MQMKKARYCLYTFEYKNQIKKKMRKKRKKKQGCCKGTDEKPITPYLSDCCISSKAIH